MSEDERVEEPGTMDHREITLADGRYMIFYTFEEPQAEDQKGENKADNV
ncbi:MAG TPA: hypothetical protein VFZ23_10500 [Pyrinomonadaceae bacterium]